MPSSGDLVDSTPSCAAPISNALRNYVGIFRTTLWGGVDGAPKDNRTEEAAAASNVGGNLLLREAQEERTNKKFVSSLLTAASDDSSVGSGRSKGSSRSSSSGASRGSAKRAAAVCHQRVQNILRGHNPLFICFQLKLYQLIMKFQLVA